MGLVAYLTCRHLRRTGSQTIDAPTAVSKIGPLLPFGTVVVATILPLAGVIYLLTSTAWTYAERRVLAPTHAAVPA